MGMHIDDAGTYKPGDPEPDGYMAWHEWARIQHRAGIHQLQCSVCSKWIYPQSREKHAAAHAEPKGER